MIQHGSLQDKNMSSLFCELLYVLKYLQCVSEVIVVLDEVYEPASCYLCI
jgi:hypothetical protein